MRRVVYLLAGSFVLSLFVAGCGTNSDADEDASGKKAAKKSQEPKIAPLAGKLGTFDEGRIEVPLPKGWKDSLNEENSTKDLDKNLARMSGEGSQRIPGILIKVREYGDFKTLGPPDLRKFVRKRAAEVTEEKGFKKKLNVKQIAIRGFNGAEYAYTATISKKKYERLVLETVVDGRLYSLELTTLFALREESRPQLYAVATGLKFPKMVNKPTRGRGSAAEDDAEEETSDEVSEGDKNGDKATTDDAAEKAGE